MIGVDAGAGVVGEPRQRVERQLGARLPLVERVAVVGEQESALGRRRLPLEDHRRREAAQERRHRPRRQLPTDALPRLVELQHPLRERRTVGTDQPVGDRDHQRRLLRLPRRRRRRLLELERVAPVLPALGHRHPRRPRLLVPALELPEVAARGVLEHLQPVLDRAGLPVVPREIEVERPPPGLRADQSVQHPDDLGALLVDRRRVEVVDLDVFARPNRMRERPRVLAELRAPEPDHVLDALDRRRAHVARELLVAEDRQPLLERELEPVAAGDPVAGPVVEILVRDDRLDRLVVAVGRGLRARQHVLRVEDVEPLVLHRSHVEVVDRDDHEAVEVVLPPVGLLVPPHRPLQRVHRVAAAVLVARPHPDLQQHLAPGHGDEPVLDRDEVARHQREQVGRLRERVLPLGQARPRRDEVAVRQQDRRLPLDPHPEPRHHVGPVRPVGDLAEPLRLALGAVHAARHVEPLERGVGLGVDLGLRLPDESLRHVRRRHRQPLGVHRSARSAAPPPRRSPPRPAAAPGRRAAGPPPGSPRDCAGTSPAPEPARPSAPAGSSARSRRRGSRAAHSRRAGRSARSPCAWVSPSPSADPPRGRPTL